MNFLRVILDVDAVQNAERSALLPDVLRPLVQALEKTASSLRSDGVDALTVQKLEQATASLNNAIEANAQVLPELQDLASTVCSTHPAHVVSLFCHDNSHRCTVCSLYYTAEFSKLLI